MSLTATAAPTTSSVPPPAPIHDQYVKRLKARLARPAITVTDARDGILDCFVSTYFEGVNHGLRQLVGIKAEPDEVARVTAQMFRTRLARQGVSFEAPTLEALSKVKDEVDQEFHFSELPAEHRAVHDQVCTLLVAKADGTLEHKGDRSVVMPARANEPVVSPAVALVAVASTEVAAQLRATLSLAVQALGRDVGRLPVPEVKKRLRQLDVLAGAIEAFDAA